MSMNPLRDAVVGVLAHTLKVPAGSVLDESKLTDLAEDSIALFELLIQFEALLGKNITYEDIATVETVGDIVAFAQTLPPEMIDAAIQKSLLSREPQVA